MHWLGKLGIVVAVTVLCVIITLFFLARKPIPTQITYGMSFNTLYARELGLNWQETYDAILNDLGVRHLRLAAHWPMVEPQMDVYNFEELDYQLARAEVVGAEVIFGVGRRLPRWPECHVPEWARPLALEQQQQHILEYMTLVIDRYKNNDAITHWQVENEPFLEVFAIDHCGVLDEAFLERQIALVRELDPSRPILVTDSGNLGTWAGAFKHGDSFGTSVYIYFWNPELGQFRTVLPPFAYRIKENIMKLIYGDKETFLIELSAEPWLLEPIIDTDLDTQYSRMDIAKFEDILSYAKETRYDRQYLWGAEWWYWLMQKGDASFWEKGKELF